MHTSRFDIESKEGAVTVIHNGDWIGDAEVLWMGEDEKTGKIVQKRVQIPGQLLLKLSAKVAVKAIRNDLISFIEQRE